jgi:hypothetical protein
VPDLKPGKYSDGHLLNDLHEKAIERVREFFIALQQNGTDSLSLGTTKTGLVYRLKGNPPQAHE